MSKFYGGKNKMFLTVLTVFFYLVIQMTLVWGIANLIRNHSIIDVFWPLGLAASGLIYFYPHLLTARGMIISSLITLWGLRLASYIYFSRIHKGIVDKRYVALSNGWKTSKSLGYFLHFQFQGLLIFLMSFVFLFAVKNSSSHLNGIDMLGVLICLVGILGETVADFQLQHFKKHSKGKVCNIGLWAYSRHPNYFFDWLTWCGFSLFALSSTYGWIGLSSPALLYIIMNYITGPMTEKGSLASRGQDYLTYQRSTSMFFVWFQKKPN
jgi:steroid 5-alpha reductase family enzyme